MAVNDLIGKKVKGRKGAETKPKHTEEDKINKSIRMKESTFLLLKKVTNRIEEEKGKYTHDDALFDGLTLLAKEKGID